MTNTPKKAPNPSTVSLAFDELLGLNKQVQVALKRAKREGESLTEDEKTILQRYQEGMQKKSNH